MQDQTTRTLAFVVAAGALCVAAWATVPRTRSGATINEVGTVLFKDFKDPLTADRLEIMKFNPETANRELFDVAKNNGVWSLPSRSNYPADAREQMARAATALVDLEILGVVGTEPSSHELFGVRDPADPDRKLGDRGVGTRVTMRKGSEILAEIIIGKEVEGQTNQRYVRHGRKGRDQVYVVKLDASKFSTEFSDWIEKDLLKLFSSDIRQVSIRDYSAGLALQNNSLVPFVEDRMRAEVAWNDKDFKWSLVQAEKFVKEARQWQPQQIGENQELNTQTLNNLKFALDDLKIADVERKPDGMSRDLKADANLANNREAIKSLAERGFIPVRAVVQGEDSWDVLSSEGEVHCGTKDGVEYVLRFGAIAGSGQGSAADGKQQSADDAQHPQEEDADGAGHSTSNVNRYLLVMARFNEDLLEKPELEPLPEPATTGEQPPASAPPEGNSTHEESQSPANQPQANADGFTAGGASAAAESGDPPGATAELVATGTGAKAEERSESPAENPTAGSQNDAQAGEKPRNDDDQPQVSDSPAENTAGSTPADKAALEKMKREEIEKENQKKMDAYREKVAEGQKKAKELNDRFADWYYVISNKVYDDIHLSWDKLVKEKKPESSGASSKEDVSKEASDAGHFDVNSLDANP